MTKNSVCGSSWEIAIPSSYISKRNFVPIFLNNKATLPESFSIIRDQTL